MHNVHTYTHMSCMCVGVSFINLIKLQGRIVLQQSTNNFLLYPWENQNNTATHILAVSAMCVCVRVDITHMARSLALLLSLLLLLLHVLPLPTRRRRHLCHLQCFCFVWPRCALTLALSHTHTHFVVALWQAETAQGVVPPLVYTAATFCWPRTVSLLLLLLVLVAVFLSVVLRRVANICLIFLPIPISDHKLSLSTLRTALYWLCLFVITVCACVGKFHSYRNTSTA